MTTSRSRSWTDLAAACSIGAGLVHAAAAGTHGGDLSLVRLFALTAALQGGAGIAVLVSPSRRNLLGGAALNVAALGAWVLSRTAGLPRIDSLADVQPVGTQDLAAALLAGVAVLAAVLALRPTASTVGARNVRWLSALAVVPAVVGMAAPHAHDASHDHDHGHQPEAAASASASTGDDGTATHGHDGDEPRGSAADHLLAGADLSHATDAELAAAVELVEVTRAALDPAATSEAVVTTADAEAAGYVWIGDGRRRGGFQHYINPQLLADGHELDPDRIEALVFENTERGPVLVSAMYLLDPGATMADVPDVAGDLTQWHDHQNLCWDATGTRLAGVSLDGETCRPSGTLRATPPMLHVWLDDHDCGPFAGVEGHGAACEDHDH
jgi:hypothetical protein